jgi:hypothetical protein
MKIVEFSISNQILIIELFNNLKKDADGLTISAQFYLDGNVEIGRIEEEAFDIKVAAQSLYQTLDWSYQIGDELIALEEANKNKKITSKIKIKLFRKKSYNLGFFDIPNNLWEVNSGTINYSKAENMLSANYGIWRINQTNLEFYFSLNDSASHIKNQIMLLTTLFDKKTFESGSKQGNIQIEDAINDLKYPILEIKHSRIMSPIPKKFFGKESKLNFSLESYEPISEILLNAIAT